MRHVDTGQPWWEATVGDLARLTVQLTQINPALYPLTAPHLRATDEQITDAERRLDRRLDSQHRALLQTGNGWPGAFNFSDLLSTDELGQGPLWDKAQLMIDITYEDGPSGDWPPRNELLPIVVSPHDQDVWAIWTGGPVTDGGHPVLWFASGPIDEWPNVYEFMLGMTVLAQAAVKDEFRRLEIERH